MKPPNHDCYLLLCPQLPPSFSQRPPVSTMLYWLFHHPDGLLFVNRRVLCVQGAQWRLVSMEPAPQELPEFTRVALRQAFQREAQRWTAE